MPFFTSTQRHWKTPSKESHRQWCERRGFMHDIHLSLPLTKIRACRRWSNPGGPAGFSYSHEVHLLWNRGRESSWHTAPLEEIFSTFPLFSNSWFITKLGTLSKQFNKTHQWLLYYLFPHTYTVKWGNLTGQVHFLDVIFELIMTCKVSNLLQSLSSVRPIEYLFTRPFTENRTMFKS